MNAPTPVLSLAGPADLPLIRDLAHRIWHAHYPGIISLAQIDYMLAQGYNLATLQADLDRGVHFLLAHLAGQPVGFAAVEPFPGGAPAKLHKLYVLPACQGQGLGRALLARAEDLARAAGAASLFLQVNKSNAGAIAMYQRCGYTLRGPAVVPIGGGFVMDDWIYQKSLA